MAITGPFLDLTPQTFTDGAITQLPALDLYQYAFDQLPQTYQTAPNFIATLQAISVNKQYLYDVIRSFVNIINMNNIAGGNFSSFPTGIYTKMLAQLFNAPYNKTDPDFIILNSSQTASLIANSRGQPEDFYQYFSIKGISGFFTNEFIFEDNNATIYINAPIPNIISSDIPNPYQIFIVDMSKIKAAGIKIILNPSNIVYFEPGSLPTDSPPFQTGPGNAGFGVYLTKGVTVNGGFFSSMIPPPT